MGIIANVAVRLAVKAVTFTVKDALLEAFAGTLLAFPGGSIDRGAIPGQGEFLEAEKAFLLRSGEKKLLEQRKKEPAGSHILWRLEFKESKKVFDSNFFDRRCFFPFLIGLFGFFLGRVDRVREVLVVREPKAALEIIKGANARGITDAEAGKDRKEMVLLERICPLGIGSNLKLHREQDGAEHVRRKSRWRTKVGIPVLHEGINGGKVKGPKFFHYAPGGRREGRSSIWIIFTQLCQDTVLVGGMAAGMKRFQKKRPQSKSLDRQNRNELPC